MSVEAWRSEREKKLSGNILQHLDLYKWGPSNKQVQHIDYVRNLLVSRNLSTFEAMGQLWKFQKRITAISWHPKSPYLVAASCKAGQTVIANGIAGESHNLQFEAHRILKESGPGGAIFSIKWHENDPAVMFTASLDGTVCRRNILNLKQKPLEFYNFNSYTHWFTSMDVSQADRMLVAGDTRGFGRLFSFDGKPIATIHMNKSKIHHCEFNTKLPWLISTASLHADREVCLWDVRNLKDDQPLHILPHNKGVNIATFNPLNGTRLLTSDQKDEIRVYEGPLWNRTLKMKHPHRQFQHLTSIKADWHPLSDIIVTGRYPAGRVQRGEPIPARPIEFFDADTGELISQLHHPTNGIVSLNKFNITGEILASSMGFSWLLWDSSSRLEELYGAKDTKGKGKKKNSINTGKGNTTYNRRIITSAQRNALRGVNADFDEDDDDDEEDDIEKIKKRKKSSKAGSSNKKAKLANDKKAKFVKEKKAILANEKKATKKGGKKKV